MNKILAITFGVAIIWQLGQFVVTTTQLNTQVRQDNQQLINDYASSKGK
jgi:hypothetical protein